jgi:hypothetical protein
MYSRLGMMDKVAELMKKIDLMTQTPVPAVVPVKVVETSATPNPLGHDPIRQVRVMIRKLNAVISCKHRCRSRRFICHRETNRFSPQVTLYFPNPTHSTSQGCLQLPLDAPYPFNSPFVLRVRTPPLVWSVTVSVTSLIFCR